MLPGLFYRKLKQGNKNFRIYPNDNLDKPSGLYLIDKGELRHVCGVDNRDIPERHYSDFIGHVIKRGWRVTVQILINKSHLNREDAERLFDTRFTPGSAKPTIVLGSAVRDLVQEVQKESALEKNRVGGKEEAITLKSDMVMDFAKEMEKEDPVQDKSVEQIYGEQQNSTAKSNS